MSFPLEIFKIGAAFTASDAKEMVGATTAALKKSFNATSGELCIDKNYMPIWVGAVT